MGVVQIDGEMSAILTPTPSPNRDVDHIGRRD
jgi:hypothetical protein